MPSTHGCAAERSKLCATRPNRGNKVRQRRWQPSCTRTAPHPAVRGNFAVRSEEHTSELQSLMRISYAVFCLKKKKKTTHHTNDIHKHTHNDRKLTTESS